MSINKLLGESNKWLQDAEKNAVIKTPPKKPGAIFDDFVKKREVEIKARISTLEQQRDAAVKRIDLAIAEQKKELERLRKEVAPPRPPSNKNGTDRPAPRRQKKSGKK